MKSDFDKKNVLVTGGAGFIGSNLVEHLLVHPAVKKVRVLDNLSTGHLSNLSPYMDNPNFEFVEGDIRNAEDCHKACEGMHLITHQAALGSVPRSINDPLTSHQVNVNGFINMLEAARAAEIKRMVYASSSSVYGNLADSPKQEARVGKILSPYAATKACNELYAEAYARNYGMQLVGFRYFNVFGPRQDPNGPYAAVIPLFIKAALNQLSPIINGDGSITRDFTPVSNVVQVNIQGMLLPLENVIHEVVNVACGQTTSLLTLWQMIMEITGTSVDCTYGPNRPGDIMFSLADIDLARKLLNYNPNTAIKEALTDVVKYYKSALANQ